MTLLQEKIFERKPVLNDVLIDVFLSVVVKTTNCSLQMEKQIKILLHFYANIKTKLPYSHLITQFFITA